MRSSVRVSDGVISSWNNSAERMFGYTAEEAIGQHITLIVPPIAGKKRQRFLSGSDKASASTISKLCACAKMARHLIFH